MATENTLAHTIRIPLGVLDARAHVHEDGTVTIGGHDGYPLPRRLTSAVWTVLETWMVERDDYGDGLTGSTVIPMDGWCELFAHRLQPVA